MITSKDIIQEAETWINTPFKHQGRVKNIGVDCYGLIIEVSKHFGLDKIANFKSEKHNNYNRIPDPKVMWNALRSHMIEIPLKNAKPGCVFFMSFGKEPMHLAIYDGENIIHSLSIAKKCVKQIFTQEQKKMVRGTFLFKGVQY